jgi:GNAT superfamily N-acetyltransferase
MTSAPERAVRAPAAAGRAAVGRVRRAAAADAHGLACADVQAWRETYPGIVPQRFLDRLDPAWRRRYWRASLSGPPGARPESVVFVAEIPGRAVAGFGACGDERVGLDRFDGEFHALYLVRAAHGLGLGRRLMEAMARELVLRGCRTASVWTLRANARARRFYEKLGGVLAAERTLDFDGTAVPEVCYGWADVRRVLDRETGP